MKIVLPVHHFPPAYNAGAELYTLRLARRLQAHDHDVEVVCIEAIDRGAAGALQAERDQYDGIPVWRLAFNFQQSPDRARWTYDHPLLGAWFEQYFRRVMPEIVHFQAGYLLGAAPLRAALMLDLPTILTLHDYWFLCPRITLQRGDGSCCTAIPNDPAGCAWCVKLDSRRYRIPEQISGGLAGKLAQQVALKAERAVIADRRATLLPLLAQPDAVIAPSRFLAEQFAPYVSPDRLHVSRYGLDLTPFRGLRRPPSDGIVRIGFIGQIAPHKGVHLLIEAFRRLHAHDRHIELHLYGGLKAQPAYVEHLRRLAGADQRIHFHGRFENQRVATILAGLDVTVVPSTWYENSPLAIMEAHAAGTPVITSGFGGMAELVDHDMDGLHFAPGNADDLARQLQRLLDEPGLLPKLQAGITMPRSIEAEMDELAMFYQRATLRSDDVRLRYARICR